MKTDERLKKIEKQISALTKKVDEISDKVANKKDSRSDNELYEKAKEAVIKTRMASASLLQRKLLIGYAKAAHLLDLLEQDGIVGPVKGAKPRDVLIKK